MPRNKKPAGVDIEALLRSIHVRMDSTEPDRIAHFRPTAKSIPFLEALIGRRESRAWLVTAPYGTGKSLAAAYILHLVENRPESRPALQDIESRLRKVSPSLANFASRRRREEVQGLVLVLDGSEGDLPGAIQRATLESMDRLKLGRQARPIRSGKCKHIRDALELLDSAQSKAWEAGYDSCIILWDEFGRHLESLVDHGRAGELADVQALAEYVARSPQLPTTLGVLLHQRLLQYADRASHSVRTEWAKVEGRFAEHHYVDDSRELFRLLADVITTRRPHNLKKPPKSAFKATAKRALALNWFSDWSQTELAELLEEAYPLEPATLALLPGIAGRVAQNERTLFAFLYDQAFQEPLGPDALYAYFSPAMRADTGVGGTHRRWLETESALSKADDDPATVRALAGACLLGLGSSGERARAGLEALTFAVTGYGDQDASRAAIDQLIARKLLLHRKHTDQVSLWHGTDLDVRSRLEEAKARERDGFDVIEFFNAEVPAPIWKPVAHNDRYDIRRFLAGEYCSAQDLGAYLDFGRHVSPLEPGEDGRVIYVLAENDETIAKVLTQVESELSYPRVLVAVPSAPVELTETALEVWCLRRLQHDPEIVGEDPLAATELEQFADDARAHLQRLIERVVWPGQDGPRWFHKGKELSLASARALRAHLSELMDEAYPSTPYLCNEMINRHQPSRVLVNARKKAELGILERAGTEDLGLSGHTPDASIFRTLLRQTGLYGQDDSGRFRFAQPEEIEDPGLRAVWQQLKVFFTEPSAEPKAPRNLIEVLMEPPYGVRQGVLPILFAAAYQAFPSAVAITREGAYLEDIMASEMEDLLRFPEKYRVKVLALTPANRKYLHAIFRAFARDGEEIPAEGDLIRACFDAIASWREGLPPAALTSRNVSEASRGLQQALVRNAEPTELLFERFPKIAGKKKASATVVETLVEAKAALEAVADDYANLAAVAIRRILTLKVPNGGTAIQAAQQWASCFPDALIERLPERRLSGLVTRLRTSYKSDRQLVDSLGFLLIGQPVQRWEDATLTAFERDLDAAARRIEEIALSSAINVDDLGAGTQQLAQLAEERMKQWYARYRELAGEAAAQKVARSLRSH